MIERREFLKMGLASGLAFGAACGSQGTGSREAGGRGATHLSLMIKGQALFLQPKLPASDQGTIVACLKQEGNDVPHDGWLIVNEQSVGDGSLEPTEKFPDGWFGWRLKNTEIRLPGARAILLDKAPTRAANNKPWPDPPNDEASWRDAAWIADAAVISPGSQLVQGWEDHCEWRLYLPKGTLQGRKPCQVRDIRAVWKWQTSDYVVKDLRSVTDLVVYDTLTYDAEAEIVMSNGRIRLRLGANALGWILCAPPHNNASPPDYMVGDPIEHFKRFYRVLTNPSNADMTFLGSSAAASGMSAGTCPQPVKNKDDDIFCPGMQAALL